MNRKTKIVATLGPASDSPDVLSRLLSAGVNVVRINFSHGSAEDHRERVARVRAAASELGLPVAVLADLQGPKIRIESFADGAVELEAGQRFTLDTQLAADAGTREQVAIHYEPLLADVAPGAQLLINDGAISLAVDEVDDHRIVCTVEVGGTLSGRKGVNLRGGGLSVCGVLTVTSTLSQFGNRELASTVSPRAVPSRSRMPRTLSERCSALTPNA